MFSFIQESMQSFVDYETWRIACAHFDVTDTQCGDYNRAAVAFAQTTAFPNTAVVEVARKAALEALARGEPMPQDIEAAVQDQFARQLARFFV